jgi:preprotein translocase subunit SecG
MTFVVGVLTFVLVLLCLFLILLVLVQLPKKDAGAGMAFGGGTADALFGAGSGNALTKITKYTAVAFLALSLLLNVMGGKARSDNNASEFQKKVEQAAQQAPAMTTPAPAPAPAASAPGSAVFTTTPLSVTNAAVRAATNSAK